MNDKTALVIVAHPDDEVLGCGGTMAKLAASGWKVHILIMAEGATSRLTSRDRDAVAGELSTLRTAAHEAAEILGADLLDMLDFPDNRMDSVDLLDVVKSIERAVASCRPRMVLTHHASDVNVDHTIINNAVAAACRPTGKNAVSELLFFEVASSTEWRPTGSSRLFEAGLFVDISESLHLKKAALGAYASEMRPFPHPRSVEAVEHLARWRGATIDCAAAEAFAVGRIVVKQGWSCGGGA
jgi:LmbE family N-acetylglucosaminyl deacetylase